MGVFNNFPYANFHDLNADWIIEQVRKVMDEWEEYRTDMNLWKLGVDDQLAEFQAWFDNLDVQDEVRTVINELILSGEFIEITSPQIVSATEAWLAAHITPTTPAVDDTLSISGAAADAKVTGDRTTILKEDIEMYNAGDAFLGLLTKASGTSNGITYTWNGDVCTVSGIASNYSANVLLTSQNLPKFLKPLKTFRIKYNTSNPDVLFRIRFLDDNNTEISTQYAETDRNLTIPQNAVKWNISLFVNINKVISPAATVSDIRLLFNASNEELEEADKTSYMYANKGALPDNTDLNDVTTDGRYVLSSSYTYDNCPYETPSVRNGILEVIHMSNNTMLQRLTDGVLGQIYVRQTILAAFDNEWSYLSAEIKEDEMEANCFYRLAHPTDTAFNNNKSFNPRLRKVADNNYSAIIIPVKAGEKVFLQTQAGSIGAKPYAKLKYNYLIDYVYSESDRFKGVISFDYDGFLVVHKINTYAYFQCWIYSNPVQNMARNSQFVNALSNPLMTSFPKYNENNICEMLKKDSSWMGILHHWGVIGASFDSGEFNFRVGDNVHVSEIDWYEYSCWEFLRRLNAIPDMYLYCNGGQNARDWIALDDGATTKPWISWEGNISRSHAYDSDAQVDLWYWDYPTNTVPGRCGIGHGGGCWWKMKADYDNGDVKQAFVINLGSNDINNNYPHDADWNLDPNYNPTNPGGKYLCGNTDDIGTYDLATNTDSLPVGGTPSTTTQVITGIYNSYAAYIGAILNRIIAIQPDAVIFLCTIRNGFAQNQNRYDIWEEYNNILKEIAEMPQYANNVYIIDNAEFGPNYSSEPQYSFWVYEHPNAMGYQNLAYYWNTMFDEQIQKNYRKMSQSMFIGTGKKYTS